ncbi:DUF2971 domain-containing protein [Vibrio cincinnatiensis]|uniref:DUF2971 domain-containing protein n=1 Tax=Vibrio cincinnatiensis TaxID=675 RepID=UPI001EDFC84A|nr:DUF2971 domain-containing protein [Vibrio cincinnatiensis]MCG3727509.1 DUF2971 domain-containing protein [Vibrio cincinnatiensis]
MSRFKQTKKLKRRVKFLNKKIENMIRSKGNESSNKVNHEESDPEAYYKYMNQSTLRLLLKNKTIKFTNPLKFNDPMDSTVPDIVLDANRLNEKLISMVKEKYPNYFFKYQHKLRLYLNRKKIKWVKEFGLISEELLNGWSGFINKFRILSLTIEPDNLIMWSHYADQHRGVVVKFKKNPSFGCPKKVNYKNGHQSFNNQFNFLLVNALELQDKGVLNDKHSDILSNVILEIMQKYFFMKMSEWSYENEYRIVYSESNAKVRKINSNLDVVEVNENDIESIIIGSSVSPLRASRLTKLIKQRLPNTKLVVYQYKRVGWQLKIEPVI